MSRRIARGELSSDCAGGGIGREDRRVRRRKGPGRSRGSSARTARRPVESAAGDHGGEVEVPRAADGHEVIARAEVLAVIGGPARRVGLDLGQQAMAVEVVGSPKSSGSLLYRLSTLANGGSPAGVLTFRSTREASRKLKWNQVTSAAPAGPLPIEPEHVHRLVERAEVLGLVDRLVGLDIEQRRSRAARRSATSGLRAARTGQP